jgi:hypothetical protein
MKKRLKKIRVILEEEAELFNKFDNDELSKELGEYIFQEYENVKESDSVVIEFYTSFKLDEAKEEDIIKLIRQYFKKQIEESNSYNKFDNIKKIISFFVGMLIIFISDLCYYRSSHFVGEILSIVGSVAIWGVFDGIITTIFNNKINKAKLNKLIKSKIMFYNI